MKPNRNVCLLNASKSCEPSGFLIQRVVNFLKLNGYKVKSAPAGCGTVLVNSCCVTASKRLESEAMLDVLLRGAKRVVLFGCLSAVPNKYDGLKNLVRIGPKQLGKFNDHFDWTVPIEAVEAGVLDPEIFVSYQRRLRPEDHYVLISQGCVNRCSFCSIKSAKGAVESRPAPEILAEVRNAAARGCRDIVLLADDCGSYGLDRGTDLSELVKDISALDGGLRIKISTLYPGALLRLFPKLKPAFAAGRISYVNVPLQSGSERVLKLMDRRYVPEKVLALVKEIRRISPGTWTYTHLIVNFPTETRAEFMRSVKASLYFNERMFIGYSDNPGTRAALLLPKVDAEEGKQRLRIAKSVLGKGCPGIVVA